jgi:acyl-CoA thioesterase II
MACESELRRPASFTCQFLASARFADVQLEVQTLRRGKRSHALQTRMSQDGELILSASAWMVASGSSGLVHEHVAMPRVPPASALPRFEELADNYDEWQPVWKCIDGKPVVWTEEAGPPVWNCWMRLLGSPSLDEPVLEAARSLLWMDVMMWNAALRPHRPLPVTHVAPNLDLSVLFHDSAAGDEWLLCDSHAPIAREGLVGCTGRVWSQDGRLLTSGTSHLLCRPNPQYAEQLKLQQRLEISTSARGS